MVIISKSKLINFYDTDLKAKAPLIKWYNKTVLCDWKDFHNIKQTFNSTDSVGNDRFVFNVAGNNYRIVAMIHFNKRTIYIRFVGNHQQYDQINCKTI